MQQANQPPKFLQPLAQNDASKADIPVTSPDDTRASQSLGFPPRTGQPPEAGGVPPQLPDMNGVLNLASRGGWWAQLGGRYGYDPTFAVNPLINGYPLGAVLPAADGLGDWVSTVNDNAVNPDTVGTGWVPGYTYGATALAVVGGTVTLTPAQASKRVLTVSGVLTSNLVLVVPAWRYDWTVYNNTGGAFSVTVRTAGGSGAVVAQNGAPTPVLCDGFNCTLSSPNIGPATGAGQAMQLGQATGRLLGVRRFATPGTSTYTPTTGANSVIVEVVGAGASGAGTVAALSGQSAAGGGGGGGAYAKARITAGFSGVTITVGSAGVSGAPGDAGQAGGASSFGSLVLCPGGSGGPQGQGSSSATYSAPGLGAQAPTFTGTTDVIMAASGPAGSPGIIFSPSTVISGNGANTPYGSGSAGAGSSATGQTGAALNAGGQGSGGGGGYSTAGGSPGTGGNGGGGLVLVWEYA